MMKKSFSVILVSALLAACGSSKSTVPYYDNPAPRQTANNDNPYGTEQKLSEAEEYALQAPGKRASGMGQSSQESMAAQLAELDARQKMVTALSAALTSAAKRAGVELNQYAGDDNSGQNAYDSGSKQNTLAKSVSQGVLTGTHVVKKQKFFNSANRRHTVFVCLEYNGDMSGMVKESVKQIRQRISDEDRVKIEYDLDSFEKEVEKDLLAGAGK